MAHKEQSRPDTSAGFQANVLKALQVSPLRSEADLGSALRVGLLLTNPQACVCFRDCVRESVCGKAWALERAADLCFVAGGGEARREIAEFVGRRWEMLLQTKSGFRNSWTTTTKKSSNSGMLLQLLSDRI